MRKDKEKKITLADLGVKSTTVKEPEITTAKAEIITPTQVGGVDANAEKAEIGEIAPFVLKVEPQKKFEENEMKLIDDNMDRVKQDLLQNVINPLKDKVVSARIEAEAEAPTRGDDIKVAAPQTAKMESVESKILNSIDLGALEDSNRFSIDDSDLKELMGDDELEEETEVEEDPAEDKKETEEEKKLKEEEHTRQEGIFKTYQSQIRETIKATSSTVDLKEFRVSTKPISLTKALRNSTKQLNTAQWALPNTKRLITFSALSGEEITNLNPENFKNRMQAFRTAYSIMFNHLVDANKPQNMDTWLKTICGFDIDHLYFCLYKATFDKSNFVTYNCPVCSNLDLQETKIDSMIKYPNDEAKTKFEHLLATGEDTSPSILEPKLVQISDEYAIAFRAPNVYGLIFETSALDEEFSTKYADILSVLAYIENVYLIDKESNTIVPIDTNPDPTNVTKTVRRKVIAYYNIIKQLNSDQYSLVGAEVTKIAQTLKDDISYQIPEADCNGTLKNGAKCTHHFPADPRTPLQIFFSRHQLLTIGSY